MIRDVLAASVADEVMDSAVLRRDLGDYIARALGVLGSGTVVLQLDIKDGRCRSFTLGGSTARKSLTP